MFRAQPELKVSYVSSNSLIVQGNNGVEARNGILDISQNVGMSYFYLNAFQLKLGGPNVLDWRVHM